MTTSPYDNLPVSNTDTAPENELRYVEVELDQMQQKTEEPPAKHPQPEPMPIKKPAPAVTHQAQPKAVTPAKTIPFEKPPQYSRLNIKNMRGVSEYLLPFEESLLVPDTMPDMEKVLFAEGRADLSQPGKLSYNKDDFATGDITVYTVYKPVQTSPSPAAGPAAYADSPIDVVKSSIAFKTDKCWNGLPGDSFRISLAVKNITAEMVNERKFTVKGELLIKITCIVSEELKVFKDAGDDALVNAAGSIQAADLIYETSESTEISQEITIKEDQISPKKILKETITVTETHRQITSGKLVINAAIRSQVLYMGEADDGQKSLNCLTNKTDFTQFIVLNENLNCDLMQISFNRNDLKFTIEGQDKLLLQGNVNTLIQAYENKTLGTTTDAYHKLRDICFDTSTRQLCTIKDTAGGEISAREVINLSDSDKKPDRLLCGSCRITSLEGHHEKGRIVIDGSMPVKLLALNEDNEPFIIEHTVPLRGSLEMPSAADDLTIMICGDIKDFWFDEINSRQLEINTSLGITVWASGQETFCTIENLAYTQSPDHGPHSHMAIYVVAKGDTLWDVAKRYRADLASLAELNQLDPQSPLLEGTKLLIVK